MPELAVRTEPSCAAPEIVGDAVAAGAWASAMTADGEDAAVLEPAEFDAVTMTRTVLPTSAEVRV